MHSNDQQLSVIAVRRTNKAALSAKLRRGCSVLALAAPLLLPLSAWAADVTLPTVGATIYNPTTGANETVTQLIQPAAVVTNSGYIIFVATTVGDTYTDPTTGDLMQVVSVAKNGGGFVTSVGIQDTVLSTSSTQNIATYIPPNPGGPIDGSGSDYLPFSAPAGNSNVIHNVQYGHNGSDGHNGGGVKIFGVCICYGPSNGGKGAAGPNISKTVNLADGPITSISDDLAGITEKSVGGNGGNGGDFYGIGDAASGGASGAGGNVTLTNHTDITTTGDRAYGILAQSSSGKGGDGGSGYIFSSGGSGGASAGQAGDVSVYNDGTIRTTHLGSIGILAQSLGGSAGTGGSSYGFVAQGGGGSMGGNGGAVTVTQAGFIQTGGAGAHGVLAQSIGGDGGNSGTAGGLLGEASGAGFGGDGGTVTVTGVNGSHVVTTGEGAVGLFGQSVGGGGGNGGISAGIVALGSAGGGGGNGGSVSITLQKGATITTGGVAGGIRFGESSHGIFAQSVGGGGGSAGISAGVVALGAKSDGGGTGGVVTVETDGVIITNGQDARGVFAQSVGGGGGAAQGSGGLVSLGGAGGGGGFGGNVSVSQWADGSITTSALGADGIFAQSVGGGGGAGSASGGLVSLGGKGAGGGNGGVVTVVNDGLITTTGALARGIFAQSVGGGGGSGGDSGGVVSIGGSGSTASKGGAVSVTNFGIITTSGNRSIGLQAQSIGGGGGDGGTSGGLVTIGGSGGKGGDAGTVTVTGGGTITTSGADAHAIFAQAVGGGGGNGGASYSGSAFAGLAIGGSGGDGGLGGLVSLTLDNSIITTTGDRSDGVFVQSVGGGGGSGGMAVQVSAGAFGSVSLAIGGNAGGGGAGGNVNVSGLTSIRTSGANALGLLAQSVGGGGGNGGGAVSVSLSAGYMFSAAISAGVGGSGGAGGVGGTVDVSSGGSIATIGNFATGFEAQSVGGGGGNGGYAVSVAGAGSNAAAISLGLGLGGTGGGGGNGGTVTGIFDGWIWTEGLSADGALVQSVGGGGGAGGFDVTGSITASGSFSGSASVGLGGAGGNGGIGGTVTGRIGGDVATWGDLSNGVVIQSIGGGGGAGGFNIAGSIGVSGTAGVGVAVGLGGSGGGGGAGGQVTGQTDGEIITTGAQSNGLIVQSVGGGGGTGGFNISGSVGGGGDAGVAASFGLGGAGGTGGAGGFVTGHANDTVETFGFAANGVVIQSIGGGGGTGAFNVSGSIGVANSGAGGISVGLGGAGGGGGAGGQVIASAKDIYTEGDQATAFLAQSVGGGGGSGGFNVSGGIGVGSSFGGVATVGLGGFGGSGGLASSVGATVVGNVSTLGAEANGIVAQSMGGGGGNGGFNISGGLAASSDTSAAVGIGVGGFGGGGGKAGAVSLTVTGDAATSGAKSDAIVAQSVGGGGGSGGFNITGGLAASSGSFAGTVGVSVGGFGGAGGDAGAVDFNMNQTVAGDPATVVVSTLGDTARAVLIQSVGGGGGNGGFSISGGLSASESVAGNIGIGVGGGGGGGGDGGVVVANLTGSVTTKGTDASAIMVQSLGGGGGTGGFNISGGITGSSDGSGNLMIGVGGFGGDGGDGKAVSGSVIGNISTAGSKSSGLTYQSLGGGGGAGGFDITGGIAITAGESGAGTIGLGVGGFGGGGGSAAAVTTNFTGNIGTLGTDSYGILLQSEAGGGGTGGFNVTGGFAASAGVSGVIGVGIGGFGGGGGSSGNVTGTLTGNVSTLGDGAYGATLQSLGGSGGSGGLNVTGGMALSIGEDTAAGFIGIGVGGFGGAGGNSADVLGSVTGTYRTSGASAAGVVAQSVGGGGGAGQINVTGNIAASFGENGGTLGLGVGIGGFGGSGGAAGAVDLTRIGDTFTTGKDSDGVSAMSIGGGGGKGGINVTGNLNVTNSDTSVGVALGLGGFGGGGGAADDVTLSVTGNVLATGASAPVSTVNKAGDTIWSIADGSNGVVAQSIGGGGGDGGINISGQLSIGNPSGGAAIAASLGIGGFGGAGGDAGSVTLSVLPPGTSTIDVIAIGDEKSAVIAQSIGGGGGDGAINISGGVATGGAFALGVGGFGSAGGLGKDVDATVNANLWASGKQSNGILAQSIGGGGGSGGINISGAITAATKTDMPSVAFGLGGFGGTGNAAGSVSVDQFGQIVVAGQNSYGILAQSIGGGGGNGGLDIAADVTFSKDEEGFGIAVGIGGSGGLGADGGIVDVTSAGNIFVNAVGTTINGNTTYAGEPYLDFNAGGLVAQSIGGGGGAGGINVTGAVAPFGNPIAIGVGGTGGNAGNASAVTVNRGYDLTSSGLVAAPASIVVFGDGTPGLLAQSIGGGGGKAGMDFVIAASVKPTGDDAVAAQIVIGGSGGDAGNGDAVTVNQLGDIATSGDGSVGLEASSIGGGGGDANYSIGFGLTRKANTLDLAVGGGTGSAGVAGDVLVDTTGTITTNGMGSYGILAQSIGGGGGNTALAMSMSLAAKNQLSVTLGRSGGTGGTAGDVDVIQSGVIITGGDMSSAIAAQSIGGGGGTSSATSISGNFQTGEGEKTDSAQFAVSIGLDGGIGAIAGDVSVTSSGHLTTSGDQSQGIFAQSIGGGGGKGGDASNTLFNNATGAVLAIGGHGSTGAKAGTVTVDSSSTIITTGDQSEGILAQSIGGGGGEGGSTRTLNITANIYLSSQNSASNTMAVNVGGTGGVGGEANAVRVTNSGLIETSGADSYGVRAQSIGGGGGTGGAVLNLRLQAIDTNDSNTMSVNIGGSGGTGGTGSTVDVLNTGIIYTTGTNSAGVVAQSVGGGGGDGGLVLDISGGVPLSKAATHSFLMDIGGSGGSGGTGGDVTVTNHHTATANSGSIITLGDSAYGILAQSIGGGGGNGSSIIQATAYLTGENSATAGLSIGGAGGSGNKAGLVTVTNDGLIETAGSAAHAIVAQSVGGGGGNGGMSIAANLTIGATANTPLVSIGGAGGDGGDGNTVVVNNTGTIITTGEGANGILAQSIGGGGGNANMGFSLTGEQNSLVLSNAVSAVIGALSGGTGGTGGAVTVNQTGNITVLGQGSQAIVAQSINGGGGTLVLDFDGITGLPGIPYIGSGGTTITPMPAITALVGGTGNTDMNAGSVTVNAHGTIVVGGDYGTAGLLQSIGGGGGTLDLTARLVSRLNDASITTASAAIPVSVSLGGIGGANDAGGNLTGTYTGNLGTVGTDSPAQLVQTVGGGGGRANIDLIVPQDALLGPITVALGGFSGVNDPGGAIQFIQAGALSTAGAMSPGALLQSVGGGGGTVSINLQGAGAGSATLSESLGASGGSGFGGAITATFSGGITTTGNNSLGLFAQSVGAGGGEIRMTGVSAYDVSLGGTNDAVGNGGAIAITNTGSILTSGVGSHGAFLQSIGGGGGAVFGDPTTITLNTSNSGGGGAISFTETGNIIVTGAGANAVVAQSIGGGGGWIDGLFAGTAGGSGAGGTVSVRTTGNIEALGADATAIIAQSEGGTGQGNITIDVLNPSGSTSLVLGGLGTSDPENGAGVKLLGGVNNVVNNAGVITAVPSFTGTVTGVSADDGLLFVLGTNGKTTTVSGITGYAVVATGGANTTVNNSGLMMGSVDLGTAGRNAFNNLAGAVFDSGSEVVLGAGNALTNAGTLSPGAFNKVFTTTLTGNLVQTSTGLYGVDLDLKADVTDRTTASGTAAMSGSVFVNIVDPLTAPGFARPGTHAKVIVSAAGGATHSGLALHAFNTAVATYSLTYPDSTKIDLQTVIEYSPAGLTGNQHSMGYSVDTIQAFQSSPAFRPIAVNLFYLPDVATLGAAYDSLSGEGVAALEQASFDSNEQFLTAAGGEVGEWLDGPRSAGHASRLWMRPYGSTAMYGGNRDVGSAKVKQSAYGIAGGFDYQITERTLVGIAMGGGTSWVNIPDRQTKASVDNIHIGLYGATKGDAWTFSGAISYDIYKNAEARVAAIPGVTLPRSQFIDGPYVVPGFYETPGARYDATGYSGQFEAGYHYDLGLVRATPFVGLEFGVLRTDGFTEANAGQPSQIGLQFNANKVKSLPGQLGVKFDASTDLGDGMILSGWVKGGWKHEFAINRMTDAEFIAAPGYAVRVHGAEPSREAAAVDAGLRFNVNSSVAVFTNFNGTYGGPNASYAGSAGVSIRW